MKTEKLKNALPFLLALAVLSTAPLHARSAEKPEWVVQGPDEDKTATIYLSTKFVRMKGSFEVVPASPSDTRDNMTGTFLVGHFKYIFKKPTVTGGSVLADEILATNILECKEGFYGTINTIKKLKNKVVQELKLPDDEFHLFQASGKTLWRDLCELHALQEKESNRRTK